MTERFAEDLCELVVSTLCCRVGFEKTNTASSKLLSELLSRYLLGIAAHLKCTAELANRDAANEVDVLISLKHMLNIDQDDLMHFARSWGDRATADVGASSLPVPEPATFPVDIKALTDIKVKDESAMETTDGEHVERPAHIHPHFPPLPSHKVTATAKEIHARRKFLMEHTDGQQKISPPSSSTERPSHEPTNPEIKTFRDGMQEQQNQELDSQPTTETEPAGTQPDTQPLETMEMVTDSTTYAEHPSIESSSQPPLEQSQPKHSFRSHSKFKSRFKAALKSIAPPSHRPPKPTSLMLPLHEMETTTTLASGPLMQISTKCCTANPFVPSELAPYIHSVWYVDATDVGAQVIFAAEQMTSLSKSGASSTAAAAAASVTTKVSAPSKPRTRSRATTPTPMETSQTITPTPITATTPTITSTPTHKEEEVMFKPVVVSPVAQPTPQHPPEPQDEEMVDVVHEAEVSQQSPALAVQTMDTTKEEMPTQQVPQEPPKPQVMPKLKIRLSLGGRNLQG